MCGCFCFVVVPYAFLAIVAFVFLWGCLVHVVFIHVLGRVWKNKNLDVVLPLMNHLLFLFLFFLSDIKCFGE